MNHYIDQFRTFMEAAGLVPPDNIEPGKLQRFSTNSRRADTSGWSRLFPDGRAGVCGNFRTGYSSVWTAKDSKLTSLAQRQQHAVELQQAKAEAATQQSLKWTRAAAKNAKLWGQALIIKANDPVARYLAGRGIQLETWPQALRYHPSLVYWEDGQCAGRFAAMLGAVTDSAGQLITLHRTYLSQDGRKADVEIVKKLTAASARMAGCSVKLGLPTEIDGVLSIAVAEGIETALACFAASSVPTVSAVSASGLERYQWPEGVQRLIAFADNDVSQVGQRAAAALARRAKSRGMCVRVLTPPVTGTDWADVWASQVEVR